jgi:hypothetical protein
MSRLIRNLRRLEGFLGCRISSFSRALTTIHPSLLLRSTLLAVRLGGGGGRQREGRRGGGGGGVKTIKTAQLCRPELGAMDSESVPPFFPPQQLDPPHDAHPDPCHDSCINSFGSCINSLRRKLIMKVKNRLTILLLTLPSDCGSMPPGVAQRSPRERTRIHGSRTAFIRRMRGH